MSHTVALTVVLGSANAGLSLEAQIVDTSGANVGAAQSTIVELGGGNYLANLTVPDGQRGAVKVQLSGGGALKATAALNPEESENADAKTSTRLATSSYTAPDNASIATLLGRLTSTRAGLIDNLDVAISTRLAAADYVGPDNADVATLLARLTATRATLLDNLANLDAAISSRATLGAGSVQHTHTATNGSGGPPLDGVEVWVTTGNDADGNIAASGQTDALGQVTFLLDPGTYYLWQQLAGFDFTNPQTITVS